MNRWVYYVSLGFILVVVGFPLYGILTDPQGDVRDLFRLGIDLEGGTSLIYELRPSAEGAEPPDARDAKRVIMQRIDPYGTRGYTVRAAGKHRLEIVLPGRQTRVKVQPDAVTPAILEAALQSPGPRNAPGVDLLRGQPAAFGAGTRLTVRMKPSLYLDDIRDRIRRAVRERMPGPEAPPVAVVGLVPDKEQWEQVAVFVPTAPADGEGLGRWETLLRGALEAQSAVSDVKRLVRQAGFLEFRIIVDRVKDRDKANFERLKSLKQAGQPPEVAQYRWYPMKKGWDLYTRKLLDAWNYVYVVDETSQTVEVLVDVGDGQDVAGQDLSHAGVSSEEGKPIVQFSLKAEAGARFARLTRPEMRRRHMAIILDGVVQSAPSLEATLSTGGIIRGYDSIRERDEVVTILNSGQLAASLGEPVTERTVGPELGADNIQKGFQASLIGFAAVVLFIAVYYRAAGMVANVALLLNLVLTVCLMHVIRQVWTLPGIAGLILSLAMAVDANVLIYERLREEKGREGSLAFALKKAYERAFRTIFDANVTTLIPAFVLLLPNLATEEVKGFAVVMIIGILVSMFTAIVVTRMIFETGMRWGVFKQLGMYQLLRAPNIDWMKIVRPAVIASGGLMALGAILFFSRGEEKYDIEFTGGTQVELILKVPAGQTDVPIGLVREKAAQALGPSTTVQELEYAHESSEGAVDRFLISVPSTGGRAVGEAAVKEALLKAFAGMLPEAGTSDVTTSASEVTVETLLDRLGAAPPAAPAAGEGAAPAAPAVRYIPPEERQFLGKIRILAEVTPPMPPADVQRRLDAFIRDRYPDLVGTLYRVTGQAPGPVPGEFRTFDIWVRQDFGGKRVDQRNPVFWTDTIQAALGAESDFASTTSFEPAMAGETWDRAVIAIVFSFVAMICYIWVRFANFASGLAAVMALVHDVVVTLGAVTLSAYLADTWFGTGLLLTDFRVNLPMVGAFLTLVGYSINDTIVVFDRIRENRGKYGDLSVSVVNASLNQTLSRTVLTSLTVLLAVTCLYFFAGRTSSIHGLSFVMLFGGIVGTYSSTVVAAPILVLRDFLYRLYVWAYPVVGIGLLAYFAGIWQGPAEFFGSAGGWIWAVLQMGWVLVVWSAASNDAAGRPWAPAEKSPALVQALAGVSLLAPLGSLILPLVMLTAPPGANWTAWAGPAAVGLWLTLPATWLFCRLAWGKKQKN